jgi:hypothetical protein
MGEASSNEQTPSVQAGKLFCLIREQCRRSGTLCVVKFGIDHGCGGGSTSLCITYFLFTSPPRFSSREVQGVLEEV